MKMNLACGPVKAQGWLNVDPWLPLEPDVAARVEAMPFRDGSFERIYAGHLVEHLYPQEVAALFGALSRLTSVVGLAWPDWLAVNEAWMSGQLPSEEHGNVRLGGRRYPGDEHRWLPKKAEIADLAAAVGFTFEPSYMSAMLDKGWPIANEADPNQHFAELHR